MTPGPPKRGDLALKLTGNLTPALKEPEGEDALGKRFGGCDAGSRSAEDGGDPGPALSPSLIKPSRGRHLLHRSWLGHPGGLRSLSLSHVTHVSAAAGNRRAFAARTSGFLAAVSLRPASVGETHGGGWQPLRCRPRPQKSPGSQKGGRGKGKAPPPHLLISYSPAEPDPALRTTPRAATVLRGTAGRFQVGTLRAQRV